MSTEFFNDLISQEKSLIVDLSYKKKPLLIAFAGMAGALGMLPFEFFQLTKEIQINKVFIRDLNQVWYHSGLKNVSDNVDDTVAVLTNIISDCETEKVVAVGNSMGGYASILYGTLINAHAVHAFSPQTYLYETNYIRNKNLLSKLHSNFPDKYFDLSRVLQLNNNSAEINVYFDSLSHSDSFHAMNLSNLNNVKLHSFYGGSHGLIRLLKNTGKLQEIITEAFCLNNESLKPF